MTFGLRTKERGCNDRWLFTTPKVLRRRENIEMALRDRQILSHLDQLPSEIAQYIMDEVRAYRARLAQGARRVLKGHISKGSIIDYLLNEWTLGPHVNDAFFQQRANTWKSLRLNWTPRESRYWERREIQRRDEQWDRPLSELVARQWGNMYTGA